MEFTLVDYQVDAVADILDRLNDSRKMLTVGAPTSFGLSAATGAGKTVIAAAVIESLFFGNEEEQFLPDPRAVVLWFSKDPMLNKQTMHRIMEASKMVGWSRLHIIDNTFDAKLFEPGHVYFINTDKFASHSLLVRGHAVDKGTTDPIVPVSDARRNTIWDTIRNTIQSEEHRLYLFVDEAHEGIGGRATVDEQEKDTILSRLINGHADIPPMPVVFGISATIERFKVAMGQVKGRMQLEDVEVDRKRVMASGLVKNRVTLAGKGEDGKLETALLRRGVNRLREMTGDWGTYTEAAGEPKIHPLMVLQVPNLPNKPKEKDKGLQDKYAREVVRWNRDVAEWMRVILDEWSELTPSDFAHVFGDRTPLVLDDLSIPYIAPERVQDKRQVRVLLAKDAISTGWDCPRAEVLVSFRTIHEPVTITQMIGRLVRNPLRRQIEGYGSLNSVYCALPYFNTKATNRVVEAIRNGTGGEDDPLPVAEVLIEPVTVERNPVLDAEHGQETMDAVFEALASTPSYIVPKRPMRPVTRFLAIAKEQSEDDLNPNGVEQSEETLNRLLDSLKVLHQQEITRLEHDVATVVIEERTVTTLGEDEHVEVLDAVAADNKIINDAFGQAKRTFGVALAENYVKHLIRDVADTDLRLADKVRQAHITVAAMARIAELVGDLERQVETLCTKWLDARWQDTALLEPARQKIYEDFRAQSAEPQVGIVGTPVSADEKTVRLAKDEERIELPTFKQHLLSDQDGNFPWEPNQAEKFVLETEMARKGFLGWYRNPPSGSREALRIPYERGNAVRMLYPDFVFIFNRQGTPVPAIVDPHGSHLSDALPKLCGLADFAEKHGEVFSRIEAVNAQGGGCVYLDLKNSEVRQLIRQASDPRALFMSSLARGYGV